MCAKQTAAEAEEKINGVLKYTDDFRKPFHHFPVQNAKKYNSCTANIKPARGTICWVLTQKLQANLSQEFVENNLVFQSSEYNNPTSVPEGVKCLKPHVPSRITSCKSS